jgi:hypothetical protein
VYTAVDGPCRAFHFVLSSLTNLCELQQIYRTLATGQFQIGSLLTAQLNGKRPWIALNWLRILPLMCYWKHGKEHPGTIEGGKISWSGERLLAS